MNVESEIKDDDRLIAIAPFFYTTGPTDKNDKFDKILGHFCFSLNILIEINLVCRSNKLIK